MVFSPKDCYFYINLLLGEPLGLIRQVKSLRESYILMRGLFHSSSLRGLYISLLDNFTLPIDGKIGGSLMHFDVWIISTLSQSFSLQNMMDGYTLIVM